MPSLIADILERSLRQAHFCRKLGASLIISIVSRGDTPLGEDSDIVLEIGKIEEPCPFRTNSHRKYTAMIALTDALALATMSARGFTKQDFAVRHHGGYLGKVSREE